MFSLGKWFGHDQTFFDLLEQSAQQADRSVHHLVDLLAHKRTGDDASALAIFAESRREDKRITQELTQQLSRTFVTPFEREDIQELAASLYKIPKTVEKIGERILIFPQHLQPKNLKDQVQLLDDAAEAVLAMVKQLRQGTDLATAREMNANLQTIEGNADKLELELLKALYESDADAKQMMFLRDLYDLLEKAIDRCRDAGNVVLQIVLKYT
jgi:uncharacterized protein Yka (UPF0111/DUF47 family)